jgi:hypothetical protein
MIEKIALSKLNAMHYMAITEPTKLLNQSHGRYSPEKYEELREGGNSFGAIQMGILEVIIAEFPELDDLQ